MNRKRRLESAKHWLRHYHGANVARAYRKRFGVDWPCAFKELQMLGVEFDPAYVEQVLRLPRRLVEAARVVNIREAGNGVLVSTRTNPL